MAESSFRIKVLAKTLFSYGLGMMLTIAWLAFMPDTWLPSKEVSTVISSVTMFTLVLYPWFALYAYVRVRYVESKWNTQWKEYSCYASNVWNQFCKQSRGDTEHHHFLRCIKKLLEKTPPHLMLPGTGHPHSATMPIGSLETDKVTDVVFGLMLNELRRINIPNCVPGVFNKQDGAGTLFLSVPLPDHNMGTWAVWASCGCLYTGGVLTVTVRCSPVIWITKSGKTIDGEHRASDTSILASNIFMERGLILGFFPFTWVIGIPEFLRSLWHNWPFSNAALRNHFPLRYGDSAVWSRHEFNYNTRDMPTVMGDKINPINQLVESIMMQTLHKIADALKRLENEAQWTATDSVWEEEYMAQSRASYSQEERATPPPTPHVALKETLWSSINRHRDLPSIENVLKRAFRMLFCIGRGLLCGLRDGIREGLKNPDAQKPEAAPSRTKTQQ